MMIHHTSTSASIYLNQQQYYISNHNVPSILDFFPTYLYNSTTNNKPLR